MSSHEQARIPAKASAKPTTPIAVPNADIAAQQMPPSPALQRARRAPELLVQGDVLHLQRTLGNRAVSRVLATSRRADQPIQRAVIQRDIDENLRGVTEVNAITADVFSVTHQGGNIIIKFKGDLQADTTADQSLRQIGANAPESKLVSALYLLGRLPKANEGPGDTEKLRKKLEDQGDTFVLVAEKLKGAALGPDASRVTKETRIFLNDPAFASDLGRVAAYDTLLGHQDRVLGGMNWGNIMTPTQGREGLQQIDNQIQDNEVWMQVAGLEDMFASIIADKPSKLAAKVAMIIEQVYDVPGFGSKQFQESFVLTMEQYLKTEHKLTAYLKTVAGDEGVTMQGNNLRLSGTLAQSKGFVVALSKIKEERKNMLEQAKQENAKQEASAFGGLLKTFTDWF